MTKLLKNIMLIDDNPDDNFFHEREIKKSQLANSVVTKERGEEALKYLQSNPGSVPDLIFLDINMPGMNGWEFLREFRLLNFNHSKNAIIIMLTTSDNPDDAARAKAVGFVSDYITKPLTKEILGMILTKHFMAEA